MSQNRDVGHPIFFGESRSRRFGFVLSHLSEGWIHPTDKDLFVGSPETGHPFPGGGVGNGKSRSRSLGSAEQRFARDDTARVDGGRWPNGGRQ